jgi:hypothetical protein
VLLWGKLLAKVLPKENGGPKAAGWVDVFVGAGFAHVSNSVFATGDQHRINLKTALEMRSEWPTASNRKRLQTLTISPFWSDAEQFKVPSKQPLAAPLHF